MSKQQKKIEIEKYLPGLFARTEGYASNVSKYYTAAVNALLDLAADVDLEPEEVFYFADHKKLSVKATNVLRGLYSAVYQEIRRGVIAEWEFANLSNDAMIESIFGPGLQEDNHYARWFSRNRDAMDAFFKRKSEYGGLNLSQKVWKYTGQFKEEMELALSASLGRGDSAATVSRHVRQYLQEPDKLFRRVRDEEGNLKLSKRAAAYHPGRGEYRSSYRNAMRLARTETNMAYRAADCERWSDIPFVVGMEVRRSNHPFACSVCEALAGKYPKDFKFVGWHPQCRCYIVPVLADEKERMAYHKAMLNGEDVEGWKFDGEITEPHSGFKKWMNDNAERVERARERGTLPYWMKDNEKYVGAAAKPQPTGKGVFRATDAAGTVAGKDCEARIALHNERAREYKRLVDDPEYKDVEFDEKTLGLKATHYGHNADDENDHYLYFGNMTKADLERECQGELFRLGHRALLLDESLKDANGQKLPCLDLDLDGKQMDIASRTEVGYYGGSLFHKQKQLYRLKNRRGIVGDSMLLYFHDGSMFSEELMENARQWYYHHLQEHGYEQMLYKIYVLVKGGDGLKVYEI